MAEKVHPTSTTTVVTTAEQEESIDTRQLKEGGGGEQDPKAAKMHPEQKAGGTRTQKPHGVVSSSSKKWIAFAVVLMVFAGGMTGLLFFLYQQDEEHDDDSTSHTDGMPNTLTVNSSSSDNGEGFYEPTYYPTIDNNGIESNWYNTSDELDHMLEISNECHINPTLLSFTKAYDCSEITGGDSPNSYWDNELFHCRLDQRPCDVDVGEGRHRYRKNKRNLRQLYNTLEYPFTLTLSDGKNVSIPLDQGGHDVGAHEVWLYVDSDGGSNNTAPKNVCVTSDSEGYKNKATCVGYYPLGVGSIEDLNDFVFGSLVCPEEYDWGESVTLYVIVDGVLVDSCPPQIARDCRDCAKDG